MSLMWKVMLTALVLGLLAEARDRRGRKPGRRGKQRETRPKVASEAKDFLHRFMDRAARKHGRRTALKPESLRGVAVGAEDRTELGPNRDIVDDLFEVDIVLTAEQAEQLYRRGTVQRAVGGPDRIRLWPRTVPYRLDFDGDSGRRAAIEAGLDQWRQGTCLRFVESPTATDRLNFIIGGGCYSYIGRTGGAQTVSIGNGCEYAGIVAHEVGHALGAWHEQSRPDRDDYVSVNFDAVRSGFEGNFQKLPDGLSDDQGVPYDFGSVMHYHPSAFSTGGQDTISARSALFDRSFGQRAALSFADVKQMNLLYCSEECSGPGPVCRNGGYRDPVSCARCRCPPGLAGTTCEDVAPLACGGSVRASRTPQTLRSDGSGDCAFLVAAPPGGKVRLEFTRVAYPTRRPCSSTYAEVNGALAFDASGARVCGSSVPAGVQSEGAQLLLLHKGSGSFVATVTAVGGVEPVTTTKAPSTTTETTTTPIEGTTPAPTTSGPNCRRCRRWGAWSDWSTCDKLCGACGKRTRSRVCESGCPGKVRTRTSGCRGKANRKACPSGAECCDGFRLNRRQTFCRRIRD